MLKRETFRIAQIYVPVKSRRAVNADLVREIAESILEIGQQTPILVRADGDRYVLVEGLHRLEACKALGEETIVGFLVLGHLNTEPLTSSFETDLQTVRRKTEHLRQLRLAKEAAERSQQKHLIAAGRTQDQKEVERRAAPETRLLQDWLSGREQDGFSN